MTNVHSIHHVSLKLVSAIYQLFIFAPNDRPLKTMKNAFLFNLKNSFHSRDIQTFVIFPPPLHISRFKKANGSGIIYVMK